MSTFSANALGTRILEIIASVPPGRIWTATDFAHLGAQVSVQKSLQHLARSDDLYRVCRGLYHRPFLNALTKRCSTPDYRAVVDAISRRDGMRMLVDGMTAANDLGLTDAVPARVVYHSRRRYHPIRIGALTIQFRPAPVRRLYWAGRPAMRVVQALYWLKDVRGCDQKVLQCLRCVLADPRHGDSIREDLRDGMKTLPQWLQHIVGGLIG